ncbi:MAG: hypothetical protein ACI4PG_12730 [Candidatus Ventricola sp.]
MRRLWRSVWVLVLLALLAAGAAADAPSLRARAGYGGVMPDGHWLPIEVEIAAGSEAIDGVLTVDVYRDVSEYDRLEQPLQVAAGETARVRLSVQPMLAQRAFAVTLLERGETVAGTQAVCTGSVPEDALIVGVLGGDAALVRALNTVQSTDAHGREEIIRAIALDAACLPATLDELLAFDALTGDGLDALDAQLVAAWQAEGGVIAEETAPEVDVPGTVAVTPQARAEALLASIAGQKQNAGSVQRYGGSNYTYGSALNEMQRVSAGQSLLPMALLLGAYVLIVGIGLYALARHRGWSKLLWAAIPVTAVLAALAVAALGGLTVWNQPIAAQQHVTVIGEDGSINTEESASVSYAGQARVLLTAEGNAPVERKAYTYFSAYSEPGTHAALHDRIILGDAPALELAGGATWLGRNLMVRTDSAPQGTVDAEAWMEEDGLHAVIANRTDIDLEDAVLLTDIGYTRLGDIPAGETVQALLERAEEVQWNETGSMLVPPDTALPYAAKLSRVVYCAAYPESLTEDAGLDDAQQHARDMLEARLSLSMTGSSERFACVLVANTPQIACAQLYADGEAITRSASESLLIRHIPLKATSPDGHLFIPQGALKARHATLDENGVPLMGEAYTAMYVNSVQDSQCFAYQLERTDGVQATDIRIAVNDNGYGDSLHFELYDHTLGDWVEADGGQYARVSGEQAARCVSPGGEIYLRYANAGSLEGGAYVPEIAVEGRLAP